MRTFLNKNKIYRLLRRYPMRIARATFTGISTFVAACFGMAFGFALIVLLLGGSPDDVSAMFIVTFGLGLVGSPILMGLVHLTTRNIRREFA